MKTMCGGLFSFCFLHETVFGNGQVAITHNVGAACRSGVNYYKLLNITKMNKRFTKINRKIK